MNKWILIAAIVVVVIIVVLIVRKNTTWLAAGGQTACRCVEKFGPNTNIYHPGCCKKAQAGA